MLDVGVIAATFVITFLAELPDKSLFASLVLGTRYKPLHVWVGTAAAFAVHMAIAVAAGQVLATVPAGPHQGRDRRSAVRSGSGVPARHQLPTR